MKADIHPTYYENLKITCACGNVIIAGSTRKELKTELCSACHPFYTGKQKLIDTAGRVDKFLEKVKKMQAMKAKKVATADTVDMEQTFESETVEFEEQKPQEVHAEIAEQAIEEEVTPPAPKSVKITVKKPKKATIKVKKATAKVKAKAAVKPKTAAGAASKKSAGAKKLSKSKITKTVKK